MRFYAPHSLKTVVQGRVLYFPNGVMEVGPEDKKTVELIKKIPTKLGEITNQDGECINFQKPKSGPKARAKKPAKKQETGDSDNVHQDKNPKGNI